MGLFGGNKTKSKTHVVTTTTTNIRDIGLTGAQAIALAGILEQGAIERDQIDLAGFMELTNNLSEIAQLTGDISETQLSSVSNVLGAARGAAGDILATAKERAEGEQGELIKVLPWILVAVVGVAAIPAFAKK